MQVLIPSLVLLGITGLGKLLFQVHPALGRKLSLYIIFIIIEVLLLLVAYSAGEQKIVNHQSDKMNVLNKYLANYLVTDGPDSGNHIIRNKQVQGGVLDSIQNIFSIDTLQKDIADHQEYGFIICFVAIAILAGLMILSIKLENLLKRK